MKKSDFIKMLSKNPELQQDLFIRGFLKLDFSEADVRSTA